MLSVVEDAKLLHHSELELIPAQALIIYEHCLSGTELDPYFFPENFFSLLKNLNEQVGCSYDCHSFASGLLKISGIDNIPHLKTSEDTWPISVNPTGCKEGKFDSSTFNLISTLMMDNPVEAKRKAAFHKYIMNHAKIREVVYESNTQGVSVAHATLNATQNFLDYAKSRLAMIVSHRHTDPHNVGMFDRHSFIVLGPNIERNDLFIIEKEEMGLGFNGLRIKKLSDIIDYYKRNHAIKEEVVFLEQDINTIIRDL